MQESTLISATRLQSLLAAGSEPVILDCSFDLVDTEAGERAYAAGHLPGAQYAHLERHLSGPKHPAGPRSSQFTGRHPLPDRAAFAALAGRWGIGPGTPVVCYDDQGSPYAARAWWLLRWLGHGAVAVLDGGKAAWVSAGGALTKPDGATNAALGADNAAPIQAYPALANASMPTVDAHSLQEQWGRLRILDARALERWRGDTEPLDPVAGHIPGSLPRFFKDNLQPDGRFKPADQLRQEFQALCVPAAEATVHQCGSGVTACQNLLAMAHAGLGTAMLYPGSWSEWCADATRPVARA